jgi:hypothetical protein
VFLEAVILGIAIGLLRKGRLGSLGDMQFKGLWLVIMAFITQISPILLARAGVLTDQLIYLPFAAMCMMIIVLFVNLDKSGIWVIIPGAIMNIIAIALNGFKMPIDFEGLKYAGLTGVIETIQDGSLINYIGMDSVNGFSKYLGKFIPLPDMYPFAKVLSVGDIFIMVGIVILIQGEMKKVYYRASGSMVKYSYNSRY